MYVYYLLTYTIKIMIYNMTKYATSSLYNTLVNNENMLKGGGSSQENMESLFRLMSEKKQFLLLTFANLIIQLGITYYVMEKYAVSFTRTQMSWLFIGLVIIILLIIFLPMHFFIKFILFSIFSIIFGLILSSKMKLGKDIINFAILGTIAIYGTMFMMGLFLLFTGIQLSFQFGLTLFYILLLLILFEIMTYFLGTFSVWQKLFSIIGLILFSMYILYDTNHILRRNYYGDFITASLDYYIDILNVFLSLVNISTN